LGIAAERNLPKLANKSFYKWYKSNKDRLLSKPVTQGEIYLFVDEFTNYYDVNVGIDAIELLTDLGYKIHITNHKESGRSFISKGLLDEAKKIADFNVSFFKDKISKETPLVGIEPSAILTFRDEYLRLANDKEAAKDVANSTFTIEEFIKQEFDKKNIVSERFTSDIKTLKIHGHCHQKSLSNMEPTFSMLSIPKNYGVTIINSGCCGMAGSFGYEKEHYQISMQVGEDSLFPKVRNMGDEVIIAASGTSCRHQIKDGTNRNAKHPISVLREAFIKNR
jgi:hypothetical protein